MNLAPEVADLTIKAYLAEVPERLDEAAGIARAADTCAQSGQAAQKRSISRTTSNS